MTEPLLDVKDVVVEYPVKGFRQGPVPALSRASPSTSARARPSVWSASPARARRPSAGRCSAWRRSPAARSSTSGKDIAHLGRKERRALSSDIQVVFQDPYTSLNPSLTIEQILAEPLTVRKVASKDGDASGCVDLLDQVGPAQRRRRPAARGSSPAVSASGSPSPGRSRSTRELIVCDEPVSALDLSTQARVLDLFKEIQERTGVAYLFVSHDLAVVRHLSHRVAVMFHGEIVEWGDGDQVTSRPEHPYTQRLFLAAPVPDPDRQEQRRAERQRLLRPEGTGPAGRGALMTDAVEDAVFDGIRFGAAYYHEYQPSPRLDDRPRPDGGGRLHRHPCRRIGLVDLGTGERASSTSTGCSRCSTAPTSAGSASSSAPPPTPSRCGWRGCYPEIAGDSATGVPITGAAGRRWTSPTRRSGSTPSGSSAHRRAVHRPPGDHRLPGRQRARHPPALQPRHLPAVHRPPAADLRRRRDPQPRVGPRLLVAQAVDLGRPLACRTATSSRSTTLAWRRFQANSSPSSSAGRPTSCARYARPEHFVTTCISYEQDGVEDVDLSAQLDIAVGNAYYEMEASLAHPSTANGRTTGSSDGHLGAVPPGRPHVLVEAGAVPRHRDQRVVDRALVAATSRRTTASGGRRPGHSSRAAPT